MNMNKFNKYLLLSSFGLAGAATLSASTMVAEQKIQKISEIDQEIDDSQARIRGIISAPSTPPTVSASMKSALDKCQVINDNCQNDVADSKYNRLMIGGYSQSLVFCEKIPKGSVLNIDPRRACAKSGRIAISGPLLPVYSDIDKCQKLIMDCLEDVK